MSALSLLVHATGLVGRTGRAIGGASLPAAGTTQSNCWEILSHYDVPALKKACSDHGLVVSSVGSLPITPDRDLVHPDAHYRRRALSFYKETLEWVAGPRRRAS